MCPAVKPYIFPQFLNKMVLKSQFIPLKTCHAIYSKRDTIISVVPPWKHQEVKMLSTLLLHAYASQLTSQSDLLPPLFQFVFDVATKSRSFSCLYF